MPETKQPPVSVPTPYAQLSYGIFGAVLLAAVLYSIAALVSNLLFQVFSLNDWPFIAAAIRTSRYWISGLFVTSALTGSVINFVEESKAAKAREADKRVAAALDRVRSKTPNQNIADIQTEQVSAELQGTQINKQQLERLVKQHKDELQIDDQYLLDEIGSLAVKFLPPLPRNAKRFMNRFRVNLLIAVNRKLLTTEPKLKGQQIGKWLILMERWPQLGRSLSATPEKMEFLEKKAQEQAITEPDGSQTDPMMELIKVLAPSYVGDGQLRDFVKSEPYLAKVAARLAHFGADELAATPPIATTAK